MEKVADISTYKHTPEKWPFKRQARIFIVEDEAIIALDMRTTLEGLGLTVTGQASSGPESLTKIDATRPNLVLMDIKIKGEMDGSQAAAEIRRRYHIPVIFMTAYSDLSTVPWENGTCPVIPKPFGFDDLERALRAVYAPSTH